MADRQNEMDLSTRFQKQKAQSNGAEEHIVEEQVKSYAIAPDRDAYVKRFRIMLRTGQSYSVPYALLPLISLDNEQVLYIFCNDLKVIVHGRNLRELESHLHEERLVWMKEAPTQSDTGEGDVFISGIEVINEFE